MPDDTAAGAADRRLDAALLERWLRPRHPGAVVRAVEVLDQNSGSASRARIALEYAPGHDAGLPRTMFVKRNLEEFNFPATMYSTEVRIYRDVLPPLAIEKPAVYAIDLADDQITFTILMEDLSQRPGARLGIVTEPVSLDEITGLLRTLATLHASWWGGARLDAEPWLTPSHANPPMQFWKQIGPKLARRHAERGHRAPLVDRALWTDDALWNGFDRMLDALDSGPPTLLHGDVHAGNVYYVGGDTGGLLDWQLALRGCWALDFAYIVTTALDPDQRVAHERELLAFYLSELARHGVTPPTPGDAWDQYRRHALYGVLMWLVTPDGVHTDEAQVGYLTRCLDAAERLGTLAALGL